MALKPENAAEVEMELGQLITELLATHALLFLGSLIMLLLLAGVLRQQRNPAVSAAWLICIITVPYIAVPLYLIFGHRKLKKMPVKHHIEGLSHQGSHCIGLKQLLAHYNIPPAAGSARLVFHTNAVEAKAALIALISSAQKNIDISIFILADDITGREIISLLVSRAQAGVRIRLLIDSLGSFFLPGKQLRALRASGAEIVRFMPVIHMPFKGQTNLRNHRKIIIADQKQIWTGGRNLADDYLNPESQTHWIDLSFSLYGSAALPYAALFEADWAFATGSIPLLPEKDSSYPVYTHLTQLLPSGPDMEEDVLHDTLARAFMEARERILVVTPYFVPSETLYSLMSIAARSGIQVDILLPEKSNHRLADFARARFLRKLYAAGASIHLIPDAMLHAKAVIVDHKYAFVGSANFDLRSMYLNFEHMTLFYNTSDITQLKLWIDQLIKQSKLWHSDNPGAFREIIEGLVLITAFQL